MNLFLPKIPDLHFKSPSQNIRVLTETWLKNEMYCPVCGYASLVKSRNNAKMADFYCEKCGEIYELKSKQSPVTQKLLDGAYYTALKRITSKTNPNLFVLTYDKKYVVDNLTIVPKYFLTPNILLKRKPLSKNAERAGYIGCFIQYGIISSYGKIPIVQSYVEERKNIVIDKFTRASKLRIDNMNLRGWLMDLLNCLDEINHEVFRLTIFINSLPSLPLNIPKIIESEKKSANSSKF